MTLYWLTYTQSLRKQLCAFWRIILPLILLGLIVFLVPGMQTILANDPDTRVWVLMIVIFFTNASFISNTKGLEEQLALSRISKGWIALSRILAHWTVHAFILGLCLSGLSYATNTPFPTTMLPTLLPASLCLSTLAYLMPNGTRC